VRRDLISRRFVVMASGVLGHVGENGTQLQDGRGVALSVRCKLLFSYICSSQKQSHIGAPDSVRGTL